MVAGRVVKNDNIDSEETSMAVPQHLIDPQLGNTAPNLKGMGLSAAEQAALGADVDPSAVTDEFRNHDAKEAAWMEQQELQRMKAETDRFRAELGQKDQQLLQVSTQTAELKGQLEAMQQAQALAAQQAQTDAQFQFTQEELDNHGELLPLINKAIGKTAAQMQAEYDQKLAAETRRIQQETSAPLMTELETLKKQQQVVQQQSQQQNAARLNSYIRDLGLGDVNTLTQNPEFLKRHGSPVYPGSPVAWGDELTRHINEGNIASAEAMLEDFAANSSMAQPREDTVVPTGRKPAAQAPLSTQQTQNLRKKEELLALYERRMEDANQGIFPPDMNRSQYKQAQAALRQEIDKIPTN